LDKHHSGNFAANANGVYTLVVHNLGGSSFSGPVAVTDTLPAGLTFVSGSGGGWNVNASGGIVTASFPGAIAALDSARFDLTVAVAAAAPASLVNTATPA